MQFEKKLIELEKIVQKLEDSSTTLDGGIELFEKGLILTKDCLKELSNSKAKISTIKQELEELA